MFLQICAKNGIRNLQIRKLPNLRKVSKSNKFASLLICDLRNLFVDLWCWLFSYLAYLLTKGTSHNLLSYIYKLYLKRSRDKSFKETLLSKKDKVSNFVLRSACVKMNFVQILMRIITNYFYPQFWVPRPFREPIFLTNPHSTLRVAMATFWRTFHHNGK